MNVFTDHLRSRKYAENTISHFLVGTKKVLDTLVEMRGYIPVGDITADDLFAVKYRLEETMKEKNVMIHLRGVCKYIDFYTGHDFYKDLYGLSCNNRNVEGRFGTFNHKRNLDGFERYEPQINEFLKSLDGKLAEATINSHGKAARKGLQLIFADKGFKPVERITLDDVKYVMSVIGKSSKEDNVRRYTVMFCRYLEYATGHDYFKDLYGIKSEVNWFRDKKGSFLFRPELEAYHSHLIKEGMTEVSAHERCRRIKLMCRVLEHERGIRSLKSIGLEDLDWMIEQMTKTDRYYNTMSIHILGDFVCHFTGTNPKLEWEARNTWMEHFDVDSPEGKDFVESLKVYEERLTQRNLRPSSVKVAIATATRFYGKIWKLCGPIALKDITMYHLYQVAPIDWGISVNTLQAEAYSLGRLQELIHGTNFVLESEYIWPHEEEKRTFIHKDQYKKLWEGADELERVILAMGATLGMRRGEMADIKLSDIGPTHLHIRGKGHGPCGKEAHMKISSVLREAIDNYLPIRQKILDIYGDRSEGMLFVRYAQCPGKPMSANYIGCKITELAHRVDVRANTHSLRRLFCNALWHSGKDINQIRINMRHANTVTTETCYLEPDFDTRDGGVDDATGFLFA